MQKEGATIIALAWRCLYAEVTKAHIEGAHASPQRAYARTVMMVVNRVQAYGHKWRRWHLRQRGKREGVKKVIPKKYQKHKLITSDARGVYQVNQNLPRELMRAKSNIRK